MLDPEATNLPRPGTNRDVLPFPAFSDRFDFEAANQILQPLTAQERIEWAANRFRSGLHVLSSAGIDSALTLDHTAGIVEDVTNIDTRFLPDGSIEHRDAMKQRFSHHLHVFGPTREAASYILDQKLWETNLPEYRQITKLRPLKRAIGALGVIAYISGIRRDQTEERSSFGYVGRGRDGEIRIHPFIDWTQSEVDAYMDNHELPRHPLYYKEGRRWLDDWTLMGDQFMRMECGIQLSNDEVEEKAS
jgi:phosphoadenosine phosphosulfate reductase